jgi:predicted glycosyltransferase
MVKKKAKKKAKKKTPLEKIRKELDKLEALHEKENDIVLKITDIIDEEDEENNDWGDVSYGGTDSD